MNMAKGSFLTVALVLLSAFLAGCGGGGGSDPVSTTCRATMLNPDTCDTTLKLTLKDVSGAVVAELPPRTAGTLQALLTYKDGKGVPGIVVTFSTSDQSVALPNFGTATTDATGLATLALPASSKSGSFTISADAPVNGAHTRTATNYAVTTKSLTLKLALTDALGVEVKQIPQYSAATLQALVTDNDGTGAPGIQVTFDTSDPTVALPRFGTTKTNASGLATMELPASSKSGSFTVSANASFNDAALVGTAGYAVTFQTLTLSALTITPSSLSAGGNASVGVAVSSGGQPYLPSTPVTFTSPCITAGKAVMGPAVLTKSGVAIGSYTDKGCSTADNITASVNFGDIQTTRSGTINVLPATAGSIKFISADTTNISLKGTGGVARQEYSTLTFEVRDIAGNTVTGALVDLSFANGASVGGLTLTPSVATTDANGRVTTTVSAGAIPTSVRVVATANGITTLSNVLVISTGTPDQNHFSLSASNGNCEGRDFNQFCSIYTVTMGDHFGNPVPDGTAVNFTTNGGVIDASCLTGSVPTTPAGQSTNSKLGSGSGTCSVQLVAANPRPPNGRVIVLAYALGEENFTDLNGNNVFDDGEPFTDKSPDIYRDDNENGAWNSGEPCIGPNTSGSCNTSGDGKYNGVLRAPQNSNAQVLYVSNQVVQIFSGSKANITFTPGFLVCPAGGTASVQVKITDVNGNIMPSGTNISFNTILSSGTSKVSPAAVVIGSGTAPFGVIPMVTPTYNLTIACPASPSAGTLQATVTTPNNVETKSSIPVQ